MPRCAPAPAAEKRGLRIEATWVRQGALAWLAAVVTALALIVAMAAHGAWRAMAAHGETRAVQGPLRGYDADDHFPGAALLYAAPKRTPDILPPPPTNAAPGRGVTGTIALPALPALDPAEAAAAMAADRAAVPARAFSLAGVGAVDRGRALECLSAAIYYAAATEPDAGQAAVAQVVLNRVRHPAFPPTVCGVVYQGSERAGCQFSFACDGAIARVPARVAWARAARAASAALAGYVFAPLGLATHYHTDAVTPAWNRSLVMTDMVGAHLFHRWKGYWGTAAAFRQRYRGGEPVPGPHPAAAVVPLNVPVTLGVTLPPTSGPVPLATAGARPAPAPGDRLPQASQVLDRWRDAGRPLQ
jgi:hypothetical protein